MIDVGALQRELDPLRPLSADETQLYVDCQRQVHPDRTDAKSLLVRTFARNATPERTITRLLTGHSGSGKTTELKRVSGQLGDGRHGKKVFVSFLFAQAYLYTEDVVPEELPYQIVRQLAADLDYHGMSLRRHRIWSFFATLWDEVRSARLTTVNLGANPFTLGFTLRDIPSGRQKFRSILRAQLPTVFEIVNNDLLPDARSYLAEQGYGDLLLVIDDLDKITRKVLPDRDITNHENLFVEHAHNFKDIACSMLLTIPVELGYSVAAGRLPNLYGGPVHSVSVLPITDRSNRPVRQGEQALIEILGRRAHQASGSAGVTADDCVATIFCDDQLLRRFVRLSGGHVRSLLRALTELLDYTEALPIDAATVDRFESNARAARVRALTSEHRTILDRVSKDKLKVDDPQFFHLLQGEHVFAYESEHGLDWYDVNPLLRGID